MACSSCKTWRLPLPAGITVAVAGEKPRHHRHKPGRHIVFVLGARAKINRGAQVQQKPGGHLAVFGEHPHMGNLQACGDVPVDMAHVVVVLVFAQVGQIDTGTAQQRAVVALQQAIQALDHRPFEATQNVFCAFGFRRLNRHSEWLLRLWLLGFKQAEHVGNLHLFVEHRGTGFAGPMVLPP
jgi:hypothetical protein